MPLSRFALSTAAELRSLPAVQRVLALSGWSAFFVPYGPTPLAAADRTRMRAYASAVMTAVRASGALDLAVWLEVQAFPSDDDTAQLPARYGRTWRPLMGLGVFPDREPPRTWKPADFTDRDWGTPLPSLMDSVLHLSGDESAAAEAWEMLFGSGCTVCALLDKPADAFHERVRAVLSEPITDPALQHKAFYVPLLDLPSVSALRDGLPEVLPGVQLYLRESKGEDGFLMVMPSHVVPALVGAGLLLRDFGESER